ncbi:MAG: hypothetical protein AB7U24_00405 [Sulfurimonadaceae bacterium]
MELKDVILSTLAEIEEDEKQPPIKSTPMPSQQRAPFVKQEEPKKEFQEELQQIKEQLESSQNPSDNEVIFLQSVRERLLVLFEGFQAPNNSNIEAKIDLTLNFLEYTLAVIDERMEKIHKGKRQ